MNHRMPDALPSTAARNTPVTDPPRRGRLANIIAAIRLAAVTFCVWLAFPTFAWAQPGGGGEGKSYANQYIITLFLIGLAVFVVCKPVKRADRPKRQS